MIILIRKIKKLKIFCLKCYFYFVKLKDVVMNENFMKILYGIWLYVMKVV